MSQFIKPTSSFEQAQFEGEFALRRSTQDYMILQQEGGPEYRVQRYMWNEALSNGQYIKVGARCTRHNSNEERHVTGVQYQPSKSFVNLESIQTTLLSDVPVNLSLYTPIKTGTNIDMFWSRKGGILPGTITMVTGDPGIGKSSVLMETLQGVKTVDPEKKVLYISAEMTRVDMMDPDEFLKFYPGILDKVEFMFASDYIESDEGPTFTQALEVLLGRGYDIVVMDSMAEVQSLVQGDMGLGSGKIAEKVILNLLQKHTNANNASNTHTSFLMIQQVNKDGEFVGSMRLKHMITAFLQIRWDKENKGKKYMVFEKNRRGDVKKRLYFKLGNGVEYDVQKYEEELELEQVMSKNQDVVQELTTAELAELFSKRLGEVDEVEEMDEEDED